MAATQLPFPWSGSHSVLATNNDTPQHPVRLIVVDPNPNVFEEERQGLGPFREDPIKNGHLVLPDRRLHRELRRVPHRPQLLAPSETPGLERNTTGGILHRAPPRDGATMHCADSRLRDGLGEDLR